MNAPFDSKLRGLLWAAVACYAISAMFLIVKIARIARSGAVPWSLVFLLVTGSVAVAGNLVGPKTRPVVRYGFVAALLLLSIATIVLIARS